MDQAVGVDHFHSSRKRCGILPISAAHTAEIKGENRAKTLSSSQKTIFHSIKKLFLGVLIFVAIDITQIGLYIVPVLQGSLLSIHLQIPPQQEYHPERS